MARSGSGKKIDAAITALLESSTVTEAAEKAKIGRRTLTRWIHENADFQRRLQEARRELWSHGTARLSRLVSKAIDTIEAGLDGQKIGKARYLSAKLVLQMCHDLQTDDLECRVTDLERRVRERRPGYDSTLENLSIEQLQTRLQTLRRLRGNGDDL